MKKYMLFAGVALIFVASVFGGCSKESKKDEAIKVGIFVPLSGTMADKGKRIVDGITMAKEEINASGGINGIQVELIVEDDEGVPASAVNAATKLVNSDKVHAVIGSNPSSCTIAAMTVTEKNGVAHIAPNSSSPKITTGEYKYVFQTIPNDQIQVVRLIEYAANEMGFNNMAFVHSNDDYGMGGKDYGMEAFKSLGTSYVTESYNTGDKDFTAQINKIKATTPEAIIFWGQSTEAALFVKQMKQQGMEDVTVMGSGAIPGTTFTDLGGEYVDGTYVINTFVADETNEACMAFMNDFEKTYGYVPDLTSAQAYDGANMLFDAIKRAGNLERTAIRDAIESTPGLGGVTGVIKFDDKHSVPDKKVYITQLIDGEWVLVN